MFQTVPLPTISSYSLYTQQRYMSYWNHIYTLYTYTHCTHIHTVHIYTLYTYTHCTHIHTSNFTHLWNSSMTYTIAECAVNNSWWWTEELSETCRVSFQNKFEKLVHLVGFIIRKCEKLLYLRCSRHVEYWTWCRTVSCRREDVSASVLLN
jgi:hypothetical protein